MFLSVLEKLHEAIVDIEAWVSVILEYIITIIDVIGVIIIVIGIIKATSDIINRTKNEKITLARTIGLGLELIMCGEILRTITTRTKEELIILGIVVLIRGALAFLSHWELKNEVQSRERELEAVNEKVALEEKKRKKLKKEENKLESK